MCRSIGTVRDRRSDNPPRPKADVRGPVAESEKPVWPDVRRSWKILGSSREPNDDWSTSTSEFP